MQGNAFGNVNDHVIVPSKEKDLLKFCNDAEGVGGHSGVGFNTPQYQHHQHHQKNQQHQQHQQQQLHKQQWHQQVNRINRLTESTEST